MIQIKKALKQDVNAVSELMNLYGKMSVGPECFNKRDLAIKAVDSETGQLVGFVWGGLMAQNTIIYIDKVCARPEYARHGVINLLYKELLSRGLSLGVRQAFGVIKRDQYHDRAAINSLKMAFAADATPYTYVYGDTHNMVKELESLGASNGR